MLKSYKELIVWQKAIELVLKIYRLTKKFPKTEQYGIIVQMWRAAVAIPSNIAEGYARQHRLEYIQFLSVAYASAAELETQIIISEKLEYGEAQVYKEIYGLIKEVSSMLSVMIRKLRNIERQAKGA